MEFKRDEKGYPLKEDGTIDWEQTSKEKSEVLSRYERRVAGPSKTPPKKKRKKKKSKGNQ